MWEQGIIRINSGEVIAKPGLLLEEIADSNIDGGVRITPTGEGYCRVGLGPMSISRYDDVYAAAYYHLGRLEKVFINLGDKEIQRLWGGGSTAALQLELYKSWIEYETGCQPPVEFNWGVIAAFQDHWTFDASIFFGYK